MLSTHDLQINQLVELATDDGLLVRLYHSRVEDLGGDQIVVALPVESPELMQAVPGDAVGVISRGEKGILILRTSVIGHAMSPIPWLAVRTGGESERLQRRRNVRLHRGLSMSDTRLIEEERRISEGLSVLNISAGLLLHSTQPLTVGSHLRMKLPLPGVAPHLDANGEVVRLSPGKNGPA